MMISNSSSAQFANIQRTTSERDSLKRNNSKSGDGSTPVNQSSPQQTDTVEIPTGNLGRPIPPASSDFGVGRRIQMMRERNWKKSTLVEPAASSNTKPTTSPIIVHQPKETDLINNSKDDGNSQATIGPSVSSTTVNTTTLSLTTKARNQAMLSRAYGTKS